MKGGLDQTRAEELRVLARRLGLVLSDEDVAFALMLEEGGRVQLSQATTRLGTEDRPAGPSDVDTR